MKDNIVKFDDSVVVINASCDVTIPFVDGYVKIHHDKPEPLTNAETLYYLTMAKARFEQNLL